MPGLPDRLPSPLVETDCGVGVRYRGKVRDTYRLPDDRLVLVTTDRISAFDHVLRQAVPLKGQVLNTLAAHAFRATADVVPNAVLSVPDPNVTVAVACEALPVEFVVRGALAGHAARVYASGERTLCGATMPDGLRESECLPEPILTPTTKASEGHDEDISPSEIVAQSILDRTTLDEVTDAAMRLFRRGSDLAARRGLILVDTKYEFGRAPDGRLLVMDELHTPDSSRYYYVDGYEERLRDGEPQRQLSKEFVREWLIGNGFQGRDGEMLPNLPDGFVREIAARYVELLETLTGEPFMPLVDEDPHTRVRHVVQRVASKSV